MVVLSCLFLPFFRCFRETLSLFFLKFPLEYKDNLNKNCTCSNVSFDE